MDSEPVKVLIIISSLDNGGTENHLLNVLPALKTRGIDITVFSLKPEGQIGLLLKESGIRVIDPGYKFIGPLRNFQLFIHILLLLYISRPDYIHFFLPKAYLLGGIASLLNPFTKRIMSRRSLNVYQRKKPVLAWIERRLHKTMSYVLGNSKAVLDELRLEGIAPDRLRLIYNGVMDMEKGGNLNRDDCRNELGIDKNALVIIYVANLIEYKGHADLLHALWIINDNLPKGWRLICVGKDVTSKLILQALVADLGLKEAVTFLDERQDVHDLLSCANIGVFSSHQEGFSNSLLEKMSAGLPIIATDVGGNPEAIINKESGIIVPAENPQALGKAILQLANNPGLQQKLGENARIRVKEKFSLDRCVEEYFDLYTN